MAPEAFGLLCPLTRPGGGTWSSAQEQGLQSGGFLVLHFHSTLTVFKFSQKKGQSAFQVLLKMVSKEPLSGSEQWRPRQVGHGFCGLPQSPPLPSVLYLGCATGLATHLDPGSTEYVLLPWSN